MEAKLQLDNVNVRVKKEQEEYPEQSATGEPNYFSTRVKTEDDMQCSVQSVVLMPIKQEPELNIHLEENTFGGEKLFSCYHCAKSKTSLKELRNHIRKQHKFLFESFDNQEDLIRSYTGITSSRLHHTNKGTKPKLKKQNLILHCPFCDYITTTSTNLRQHMVSHIEGQSYVAIEKKKPYQCPFCKFNSPYPEKINVHITSIGKHYQCPHCHHIATHFGNLRRHIMSVHTKEKSHLCPHCDYAATHSYNLRKHIMLVHTKEKPHRCPHCDYTATYSSILKKHMYVHTKEKPHQCPHCAFSTSFSGTLKNHIMSVHRKEKPQQCPNCDYSASFSRTLKNHIMSVHTKKKLHHCPHCDYSATLSKYLRKHIKYVHRKEKPHQCPNCDYSSSHSRALKNHIMSIHRKEKPH